MVCFMLIQEIFLLSLEYYDLFPTLHECYVSYKYIQSEQYKGGRSAQHLQSTDWQRDTSAAFSLLSPPPFSDNRLLPNSKKCWGLKSIFLSSQKVEGRWLASFYFPSFCSLTMKRWRIDQGRDFSVLTVGSEIFNSGTPLGHSCPPQHNSHCGGLRMGRFLT